MNEKTRYVANVEKGLIIPTDSPVIAKTIIVYELDGRHKTVDNSQAFRELEDRWFESETEARTWLIECLKDDEARAEYELREARTKRERVEKEYGRSE